MTALVIGASGTVGRNVVDGLVRAGTDVRAMSRTPVPDRDGVRSVRGDLEDPDSLADAFDGVDRMMLFPVPATASAVLEAAREAGVRRVVVLSSSIVTSGIDTTFHAAVERAARNSGLEWTAVRPGEFAMNRLRLWGRSVRDERVVRFPEMSRQVGALVHESDVASMITHALLDDGHDGKAYTFTGPEQLTVREQVERIAEAIGEPVRFDPVAPDDAVEILRGEGGWAAQNAELVAGAANAEVDDGRSAQPDGDEPVVRYAPEPVAEVTGRPARSFSQWALDHRDDFRGS